MTSEFTLLRSDTMGFDELRHNLTDEIISVWRTDVVIGNVQFKAGTLVDGTALAEAFNSMFA